MTGASRTPRDVMVKDAAPPGQIGKVFGFVSSGMSLGGAIMPTMYPVKAEEAASIAKPCTWWRIVISQDWIPAPAIDETMKNAKNISTERLANSCAPEAGDTA